MEYARIMKVINQDILKVFSPNNYSIVIHQVNCQGKMEAGLAKQIKAKYPFVYDNYLHLISGNKDNKFDLLGTVQYINIEDKYEYFSFYDYNYIVNLFGQYDYGKGKHTEYSAIYNGLCKIANDFKKCYANLPVNLYIPYKMGCGLGGGDWSIVSKIITIIEDLYKLEFNICKI